MTVVYNSAQTRGKGRIKRGEGGGLRVEGEIQEKCSQERWRRKPVRKQKHTPTSPAHTKHEK